MSTVTELTCEARQTGRKGPSRRLRAAGKVPAIMYGHGDPTPITIDSREFELTLQRSAAGRRTMLRLTGHGDQPDMVMIRETSRHPVTNRLVHIDFYRIRMDEEIEVPIPVHLVGASPGVKAGGVMHHSLHHLKLRCLPGDIPTDIKIDVSTLEMNKAIHLSDLPKPNGVYLHDQDEVIVAVHPPKAEVVVEPTAVEGEGAEPEVIAKGKEKAEGEEGAEKKDGAPAAKGGKDAAPAKAEKKEGGKDKK